MIFAIATLASLVTVYLIAPQGILWLKKVKAGQTIRDEGPESHQAKTGTPTMGGLFMITGVTVGVIILTVWDLMNEEQSSKFLISLWLLWAIFIGHGILGFIDDYIKVHLKRNLGLTAKGKLLGQIILSALLVIASSYLGRGTEIFIPLGNEGISLDLGPYGFAIFTAIVLIGTSNAVNLTDGLDGLAAGVTVFSSLSLAGIAYAFSYLPEMAFALLIGAVCFGFLKYNRHPAHIFMGDTGSLALGGAIAALAILMKMEISLLIIGGIYVAEALSVMIQVSYFKITKGKRFFRMSPLHHHFELGGWSEKRVVSTFWFIGMMLGFLGYWLNVRYLF